MTSFPMMEVSPLKNSLKAKCPGGDSCVLPLSQRVVPWLR